jgi:hypothetical protein
VRQLKARAERGVQPQGKKKKCSSSRHGPSKGVTKGGRSSSRHGPSKGRGRENKKGAAAQGTGRAREGQGKAG